MKVTFFTALLNVQLAPIPGRGDQIADGLFIATDHSAIREQLTSEVEEAVGGLELSTLLSAPGIIYSHEDIAPESPFSWFDTLGRRLAQAKLFLFCSWLRKDNAADIELGFLTYQEKSGYTTHSNFLATKNAKADGALTMESFSRDEVKDIRALYRQIVTRVEVKTPADVRATEDTNRINRAFYWAQAARVASDLSERLVYECTVLEAMLSTSTNELAHQLAERTAVLLTDDAAERHEIYKTVKRAYAFRSKAVHGASFRPQEVQEMRLTSVRVDVYIRRLFTKIITDDVLAKSIVGEGFDSFMLSLLLGTPNRK